MSEITNDRSEATDVFRAQYELRFGTLRAGAGWTEFARWLVAEGFRGGTVTSALEAMWQRERSKAPQLRACMEALEAQRERDLRVAAGRGEHCDACADTGVVSAIEERVAPDASRGTYLRKFGRGGEGKYLCVVSLPCLCGRGVPWRVRSRLKREALERLHATCAYLGPSELARGWDAAVGRSAAPRSAVPEVVERVDAAVGCSAAPRSAVPEVVERVDAAVAEWAAGERKSA